MIPFSGKRCKSCF